jgi:hypothetical protein
MDQSSSSDEEPRRTENTKTPISARMTRTATNPQSPDPQPALVSCFRGDRPPGPTVRISHASYPPGSWAKRITAHDPRPGSEARTCLSRARSSRHERGTPDSTSGRRRPASCRLRPHPDTRSSQLATWSHGKWGPGLFLCVLTRFPTTRCLCARHAPSWLAQVQPDGPR